MKEPEDPQPTNMMWDEEEDKVSSVGEDGHQDAVIPTTKLAAQEERETLARQETKAVIVLRVIVLAVLACTGAAMAWFTFHYTRSSEEDEFEAAFAAASTSVLESFHDAIANNFGAMDALSTAVTDQAEVTGQVFPNVTMPGFHAMAGATRVMTHAIYVFYMPLVTDAARRGYEAYCQAQQGYLFPSFMKQQELAAIQDAYFGLESAPLPGARRERELHFNMNDPHPTLHPEIFGSEVSCYSTIHGVLLLGVCLTLSCDSHIHPPS